MTLKELRLENNLSQKEISSLLNVPERTYRRYEQDDNYGDKFKREKFLEIIKEKYEINEEKGLLTIDIISSNISSVDIQFTSIIGNAGDFGTVGYRSATYSTGGSDAGNTITSGTVDGNIISFTFNMPSSTANVYVKVEYSGGDRYDIYFYSSVACTLYVFNYDAEVAKVYVTSTGKSAQQYKETFNEISISAGTPPGGWNPSYSPITTH